MKIDWHKEDFWQSINYILFFIGAAIALYADHTNLLLFIIVAILLMNRGG